MNIYEKLQTCRVSLQKLNLKKSGVNKYSGFTYYELPDILPSINELMLEHKLCSSISFKDNEAVLTIINIDKPEETIVFTTPMADAQLKGATPIQNLGAIHTYLRRYLWLNSMEITENCSLDATLGKPTEDKKEAPKPAQFPSELISTDQAKRIFALSKGNEELVRSVIKKYGYESSKLIKKKDYDSICKDIQNEPNKAS